MAPTAYATAPQREALEDEAHAAAKVETEVKERFSDHLNALPSKPLTTRYSPAPSHPHDASDDEDPRAISTVNPPNDGWHARPPLPLPHLRLDLLPLPVAVPPAVV